VFTIEMLPAERGDCLWLTYGTPGDLHHVIVDGGPVESMPTLVPALEQRLHALPGETNRVELLVVSHVDADHIQGIVSLLSDHRRLKLFHDVWFNGYEHLDDRLGAIDGERLTAALQSDRSRWNRAFDGDAVVIPDEGDLPVIQLAGGLELTLVSPTRAALARLAPKWKEECEKAGLIAGTGAEVPASLLRDDLLGGFDIDALAATRFGRDASLPNATSIAFIARYAGRSVLCGADCHSSIVEASLKRLGPGRTELTAVKMHHHGSKSNMSPSLVRQIRSKNWLVSTNGSRYHHPDPEMLARVIVSQDEPCFHLNYVSDDVSDLIASAGPRYSVRRPRRGGGIVVKLA
jgi:hypothetical protein